MRSCRTILPRAAPNAERSANSRERSVPRTRSRLARFTQTSTRTSVTAPSITVSARLDGPVMSSFSGSSRARSAFASGYSSASWASSRSSSACAVAMGTVPRSRPTTVR